MIYKPSIALVFCSSLTIGCVADNKSKLTEEQIEAICDQKKIQASKPTTDVSIATGSEGPKYEIGITFSSDYLSGRDPEDVFEECKLTLQ